MSSIFGGGSSKTSQTYKPNDAEKLLQAPIVDRATNTGTRDLASLARAMQAEGLSRLHEPAPLDPRIASLVSAMVPNISSAQSGWSSLLQDFMGAPSAVKLGAANATPLMGGTSASAGPTPSQASQMIGSGPHQWGAERSSSPAATNPWVTQLQEQLAGTSPTRSLSQRMATTGRTISDDIMGEIGQTGELTRDAMVNAIQKFFTGAENREYWERIFGRPPADVTATAPAPAPPPAYQPPEVTYW